MDQSSCVTGDPNPAHSCCRELSHTGSRNGHRRKLGTWPSVVQQIEDGESCYYDLQTNQQLLVGAGVHRRIDTRLEWGFLRHCGWRRRTRQISGIGGTGGVTECSLLPALVERSVYTSGAGTDKAWGVLRPRKSPRKIPTRSGKGSPLINSIGHRGVCNASMLGATTPGDRSRG